MCACVFPCAVFLHTSMFICVGVCVCVYYTCACMCVCVTNVGVRVCVCVCVCVGVFMRVCGGCVGGCVCVWEVVWCVVCVLCVCVCVCVCAGEMSEQQKAELERHRVLVVDQRVELSALTQRLAMMSQLVEQKDRELEERKDKLERSVV